MSAFSSFAYLHSFGRLLTNAVHVFRTLAGVLYLLFKKLRDIVTELQIRGSTEDNFSYFSMKTYVVTTH